MGVAWSPWENYCWAVICKNDKAHRATIVMFGHKIPLGETDAFAPLPVSSSFVATCGECSHEDSYEPAEVLSRVGSNSAGLLKRTGNVEEKRNPRRSISWLQTYQREEQARAIHRAAHDDRQAHASQASRTQAGAPQAYA